VRRGGSSTFRAIAERPDFDDDQNVDIIDVLYFPPVIVSKVGDPRYDPRFDLDANVWINIIDVLTMAPFMTESCAP